HAEQQSYLADQAEYEGWLFDYQMMFTVSTIVAVAVGVAFIFTVKKLAGKYFKYIALGATVLLGVLTIVFFVLSGTNLGSGFGIGSEVLTEKSSMYLAVAIAASLLLGFVLIAISGGPKTTTTEIVYAAVCIAVSFALSYIRILKLPQGGSVTIASLVPIAVYSYKFGVKKGMMCCFIYGMLQALQDPWIVHPLQFFLDYPIAFALIGLTGLFRKAKFTENKTNIALTALAGFIVALLGRYLSHAVSGAVFFGTYGAAYGIESAAAWGFVYNLFVFADGAIAAVALFLLLSNKDVARLVLQPDLRRRAADANTETQTQAEAAEETQSAD
ncbi:MAG: energy-coupled thiamine transporter ThiT, partial [Clostridiales bacterium]|nr:energy-coupled thiamine transporter ThiT [Clostridiales bacterium]